MPVDPSRLRAAPAFASASEAVLILIAAAAEVRPLAAGERLFAQGDPAGSLYCLLEGRLKVVKQGRKGRIAIIRLIHPGDVFGLAALFGVAHHSDAAVALGHGLTAIWPAGTWRRIMEAEPRLALDLIRVVGRRLEEADEQILDGSTLEVPQRLIHLLLKLVDQAGRAEAGGTRIDLPLSRQDLAAMTGTTLHSVSRILRSWERRGLVDSGRRSVRIRDVPALVRFATQGAEPAEPRAAE